MRQLAFEVIAMPYGHRYQFFDDGSTEGFPQGSIVKNYVPLMVNDAVLAFSRRTQGNDHDSDGA
jgi:hypothetical protein